MKNKENEKRYGVCNSQGLAYERNNFFYGKLMTTRDYFFEQNYFNEKRWLINRMVNGTGIVRGLDVSPPTEVAENTYEVCITPGMAIDKCGREIIMSEAYTLSFSLEKSENPHYICIEYRECNKEDLAIYPITCKTKHQPQYNHIADYFYISLKSDKDLECDEEICTYGRSSESDDALVTEDEIICPLEDNTKPLHQYLDEKIRKKDAKKCIACGCVILGTLTFDDGTLTLDETFPNRKLVYNNLMLYKMLECYHDGIPHITDIGWKKYHADSNVSWDDFKKLFGNLNDKKLIIENSNFTINFDQKMDISTINKHTFLFAAITIDNATGYRLVHYIPGKIEYKTLTRNKKQITQAIFNVEYDWYQDEIERSHSEIKDGAEFEIILRGNSILNEDGTKALDGSFTNFASNSTSGNGVQGGDFMSWFEVKSATETKEVQKSRRSKK